MATFVKLTVYVPTSHGDLVRKAMGDAGAGNIGNYSHCTFTTKGIGTFKPLKGAHPYLGEVGKLAVVEEVRIEVICLKSNVRKIIANMKKVHPYEEPAYDIYPLLCEDEL